MSRTLLGLPWSLLGTPSSAQLRSLSLSWPLLASFLASLSLSEPTFIVSERFSEPPNPPRTSKIKKKQLVFLSFLLFSDVAQENRKSSEKASKMMPGSFQDSLKPFQGPPKTPQDSPKTPPRRPLMLQDTANACYRRAKTAQHTLRLRKNVPKTSPKLDFLGFGIQNLTSF